MTRVVNGERLQGGAGVGVEEGIGVRGEEIGFVRSAAAKVPSRVKNRLEMSEFEFSLRREQSPWTRAFCAE